MGQLLSGERLTRALLSLADRELRVRWLGEQVQREPAEQIAAAFEEVLAAAADSDPRAREARMSLALWVAGYGREHWLRPLRLCAVLNEHPHVKRLLPPPPPPGAQPSSPPASQRDFGARDGGGRELTLGKRRTLARSARLREGPGRTFEQLVLDPHPLVIRELLGNPVTTEQDVVRLVAKRPLDSQVLQVVASTPWLAQQRVRLAVLLNPGTPVAISIPLLSLCTRSELSELRRSVELPQRLHELCRSKPGAPWSTRPGLPPPQAPEAEDPDLPPESTRRRVTR